MQGLTPSAAAHRTHRAADPRAQMHTREEWRPHCGIPRHMRALRTLWISLPHLEHQRAARVGAVKHGAVQQPALVVRPDASACNRSSSGGAAVGA